MEPRLSRPIDPSLTFHLIKFAYQVYEKEVAELTAEEYAEAYVQAHHEARLHRMILTSSAACGIVIPEQTLQAALNNLIAEHGCEDRFLQHLKQNNLDPHEYTMALQNDLKIEVALALVASSAEPVSPDEVETHFRNHQQAFSFPEQRSARHILISTENRYSHLPQDSLRRRTEALHARLQKNPQSFALVAQLHSDCTTAIDGGDIGKISPGELCAPLDQALFQLEAGGISPVIQTQQGFHILYCERVHPGRYQNLQEAFPKIHQLLTRKKRIRVCRSWLQSILASQT